MPHREACTAFSPGRSGVLRVRQVVRELACADCNVCEAAMRTSTSFNLVLWLSTHPWWLLGTSPLAAASGTPAQWPQVELTFAVAVDQTA